MMPTDKPRYTITLDKEMLKAIDDFRFEYGWGDGEWMRNWESVCHAAGANLICDFVIANEAPDDEAVEACKAMGAALANA